MTSAYQDLATRQQRLYRLAHLQSIAQWDQAANMPAKGNDARSLALAEMDGLLHQLATDPALKGLLDTAATEPLDNTQRANLREIRRAWRAANAMIVFLCGPNRVLPRRRASLNAASLASAPELQKNTLSAKLSSHSRAARRSPSGLLNKFDMCHNLVACSCNAATRCGWAWPSALTATPLVKSR